MVVIYRRFIEVDNCGGIYFCCLRFAYWIVPSFASSGEAEAGTAGEQPARDNLMPEVNTSK